MKQIGEFAKENQVTIRALHHYEKLGIISPAKVDEYTGYRYYDDNQSLVLKTITFLKSLGFSLSEIKEIIISEMDKKVLMQHLYSKRQQALIDVNSTKIRYSRIVMLLDFLKLEEQNKKFDFKEMISMNEKDVSIEMSEHELFNHKAREMFNSAKENNLPLCVLSIDIDKFKKVNDDFGRDVGDIVIDRIKNIIIEVLMKTGQEGENTSSMMERDAGDEFKIILEDDIDEAKKVASKIVENTRMIDFNDVAEDLHVAVTVGIASAEPSITSLSYLTHLADSALYEAKSKGGNSYLVYEK